MNKKRKLISITGSLLLLLTTSNCFSRNYLISFFEKPYQTPTDSVFDIIKINDSTFHCICKYNDPADFAGLLPEDYIYIIGPSEASKIHISITFKQKTKIRWELVYLKNNEVQEFIFHRNKLLLATFYDEHSMTPLAVVEYSIEGRFPHRYYLMSTTSRTGMILTETEFYPSGQMKRVEVTDHTTRDIKTISKTCLDKKGNTIQCPKQSRYF